MIRRRISVLNSPIGVGLKAGSKDPRNFISGGGAQNQNWDIRQFETSRAALDQIQPTQYSQAHQDRAAPEYVVRTVPTRTNYVTWTVSQAVAYTAELLVPRNTSRLDLVMTPPNGFDMYYCWGPPGKDALGNPQGALLTNTLPLPRVGGTVPINDLWVWTGHGPFPVTFLAFEGIDALEANFQ